MEVIYVGAVKLFLFFPFIFNITQNRLKILLETVGKRVILISVFHSSGKAFRTLYFTVSVQHSLFKMKPPRTMFSLRRDTGSTLTKHVILKMGGREPSWKLWMRCKPLHKKIVYRSCKSQAITQLTFGRGCIRFLPQPPQPTWQPRPSTHNRWGIRGSYTGNTQKTVPLHLQSHTV